MGVKPLEEALHAGKTIDKVLLQRGLQGDAVRELKELLRTHDVFVQQVPAARLDRITRKNHQGVIAFMSPVAFHRLDQLLPAVYESGEAPLFLALDGVTDVRNFGAIARSAECMGAHAVIVPSKNTARIGADAMKTSAGALMRIPVCKVDDLASAVRELQLGGLQAVAMSEHAKLTLQQASLAGPTVLVLGSESDGVSEPLIRLCDQLMRIPMSGEINSLNVSVAAGIALFETCRQRQLNH